LPIHEKTDIAMPKLSLVLVTPERTLFDKPVETIRVPLFDGAAGFYPGRAPLVGRLGIGELRLTDSSGASESYFIDGGFVQVKGSVVSVLTNAAVPTSDLSRKAAAAQLESARAERTKTDEQYAAASRRLEKARKMLALASKD
jgi:F-type H+-transporting ATPase subunit epsilon